MIGQPRREYQSIDQTFGAISVGFWDLSSDEVQSLPQTDSYTERVKTDIVAHLKAYVSYQQDS